VLTRESKPGHRNSFCIITSKPEVIRAFLLTEYNAISETIQK
jgi:hypothetical protein